MDDRERALELLKTIRGQYIIGQALHIAVQLYLS